jgi:DNA adenine methylase
MKIPHPIPYQGSKRKLAHQILKYFPEQVDKLVEPFAGSAAITIATAYYSKTNQFHLNDINAPLIALWHQIIQYPQEIITKYHQLWQAQWGQEEKYYYQIRQQFNDSQQPELLLFLLARCVKAAVRYNANGEFNQSPDKRRKGRTPSNLSEDILRVSELLKGKVELSSVDYRRCQGLLDFATLSPTYAGLLYSREMVKNLIVEYYLLL